MSTQKELVIEKVKTIVERLIVSLTKAGVKYFKGNPTAEISHIKENVIVSLIDEDNIEINCILNQNLRNGKTYFYIYLQIIFIQFDISSSPNLFILSSDHCCI